METNSVVLSFFPTVSFPRQCDFLQEIDRKPNQLVVTLSTSLMGNSGKPREWFPVVVSQFDQTPPQCVRDGSKFTGYLGRVLGKRNLFAPLIFFEKNSPPIIPVSPIITAPVPNKFLLVPKKKSLTRHVISWGAPSPPRMIEGRYDIMMYTMIPFHSRWSTTFRFFESV